MPVGLLVQPRAATEHLIAAVFGDARAVVFNAELERLDRLDNAQPHFGIRPFAGVVQQVAEQLQQVFAIPRQLQTSRCAITQRQMFAVDHV
ncbi:hypothetical protein D3C81_1948500 [compost metagenome]